MFAATATRRSALMVPVGLFFGSLVGGSLAGCQSVGNAVAKLPQWAEDATTIGNALGKVAGVIGTIQGVPAKVVSAIQDAVTKAQQLAGQIGSLASSGASSAAGLVSGFGSAVTGAVSSLAGLSVPPWVSTALSAVTTLLPVVMQVAGAVLAGPAADPRAVAAARAYLTTLAA